MEESDRSNARRRKPSVFVPRAVVERIIREAPLDEDFENDVRGAVPDRIDDL
jgi:hypothetical protein